MHVGQAKIWCNLKMLGAFDIETAFDVFLIKRAIDSVIDALGFDSGRQYQGAVEGDIFSFRIFLFAQGGTRG